MGEKLIKREGFEQYTKTDFAYDFGLKKGELGKTIHLIYAVSDSLTEAGRFLIGRNEKGLFYVYTKCGDWEPTYRLNKCTKESLKTFVEKKINEKRRNIVYWWRDEILKVVDGLEEKSEAINDETAQTS